MSWVGEDSGSGVYIFRDDGSPATIAGIDGQFLAWSGGIPQFATIYLQAGPSGATGPAGTNGTNGINASGSGDFSSNTTVSVADEIVLFANTGGKLGKRATQNGIAHLTNGVLTGSNVIESEITLSNNTTNDYNTNTHGFVPRGPCSGLVLADCGQWRLGAPFVKIQEVNQNAINITPIRVSGIDMPCGIGTWVFNYYVLYQSQLATNGVRLSVNHTGTVSAFVANIRWVDSSATASTAAPDQTAVQAAGHVMGSFGARAKSTAGWGTTISVDTVNSDMLAIVEGLAVVTASGTLELWHGCETNSTTSIRAGTSVILTKTSQ